MNPRGSNPTSPASFPSRAGGCSKKGTDLERAFKTVDDFAPFKGAKENTEARTAKRMVALNISNVNKTAGTMLYQQLIKIPLEIIMIMWTVNLKRWSA